MGCASEMMIMVPVCSVLSASCIPMDCSPSGFQTRTVELVVICFSREASQPRNWTYVSCIGKHVLYQRSHQGSHLWNEVPQKWFPSCSCSLSGSSCLLILMKQTTILWDALQRGPCGKRLRGYISSYGCCNRWAQTWWLKTTEMYSLHSGDWKTETSFTDCNQGVSKAVASSGGSRGESFPWHFQPWWLPASLTCGCITPINSSMVTLPPPFLCRVTLCLSFVRILLMALRNHLESPGKSPHLKNLNLGFLWWYRGKESTCQCKGRGFGPWAEKIPHATGQISPCATTTEPLHLEPELCNNDRPTHRNRE